MLNSDCLSVVFKYVTCKEYKSIIFTCRTFYEVHSSDELVDKYSDHSSTLFMMYPDKPWRGLSVWKYVRPDIVTSHYPSMYYHWLAYNVKLTADIVFDNENLLNHILFVAYYVSDTVPIEVIDRYPTREWAWHLIFKRKDLTETFVRKYYKNLQQSSMLLGFYDPNAALVWEVYNCDTLNIATVMKGTAWGWLIEHEKVPWSLIKANMHLPWREYIWNRSETEAVDYIYDNLHPYINPPKVALNTSYVERAISELDNIDKYISCNKHVTVDIIQRYNHINWVWPSLSRSIAINEILSHPNLPWSWRDVALRNDITVDMLADHPWDWEELSDNLAIPLTYIMATLNTHAWSITRISMRTDLTWRIVRDNIHLDWQWSCMLH